MANEAQYLHQPYLTLSEGTCHRVIVECQTITPTPPRGRRAGVLSFSGVFLSVPRERSPRSAESSKDLGQKMGAHVYVSVRAFKGPSENAREKGKRREDNGERVVKVKMEKRKERVSV